MTMLLFIGLPECLKVERTLRSLQGGWSGVPVKTLDLLTTMLCPWRCLPCKVPNYSASLSVMFFWPNALCIYPEPRKVMRCMELLPLLTTSLITLVLRGYQMFQFI